MRFNSKSVMLNRGTNLRVGIDIPSALRYHSIPVALWDTAITEFNKQLDTRRQVSEIIDGVKVDVLRIHLQSGGLFIWMSVKEKDVSTISKLRFTFKGKLVYENDTAKRLEQILINDLLYGQQGSEKSIFRKQLTS